MLTGIAHKRGACPPNMWELKYCKLQEGLNGVAPIFGGCKTPYVLVEIDIN